MTAVQGGRRERKQYPALMPIQGVSRMGLVKSERPLVLSVEDEFLLRMDAADMITAADCRDLRPRRDCGNGFARRRTVSTQTLRSNRCCGRTARSDRRRLDHQTVIQGWSQVPAPHLGFRVRVGARHRAALCADPLDATRDDEGYAIMSGVIWSSMKAMRSRSCSLRFLSRCNRNKS